jgi:hypothetical protein
MVIAGLNSIGGAFAAGLFLGGPTLANLLPTLPQLPTTMIGLAAIGIGKNPNGFIANDIRPQWMHVPKVPKLLTGAIVVSLALWAGRLAKFYNNWTWTLAMFAIAIILPNLSKVIVSRRERDGTLSPDEMVGLSGSLDWMGLTEPFNPEDVVVIDRVLALPGVAIDGAA